MADSDVELIEDDFVSRQDAANVGYKIIEMADRAKAIDPAIPGAVARWSFELDDVRFTVTLTRDRTP